MPLAEKGVRGKGRQPLSPPQHRRDPERGERSVAEPPAGLIWERLGWLGSDGPANLCFPVLRIGMIGGIV